MYTKNKTLWPGDAIWRHKYASTLVPVIAITWTKVGSSLIRSCSINRITILQEMFKISILNMHLKTNVFDSKVASPGGYGLRRLNIYNFQGGLSGCPRNPLELAYWYPTTIGFWLHRMIRNSDSSLGAEAEWTRPTKIWHPCIYHHRCISISNLHISSHVRIS